MALKGPGLPLDFGPDMAELFRLAYLLRKTIKTAMPVGTERERLTVVAMLFAIQTVENDADTDAMIEAVRSLIRTSADLWVSMRSKVTHP